MVGLGVPPKPQLVEGEVLSKDSLLNLDPLVSRSHLSNSYSLSNLTQQRATVLALHTYSA